MPSRKSLSIISLPSRSTRRTTISAAHETLRITPAVQLGVTDHVWSIGELIDAALDGELPSGSGPEFSKNLDPSDTIQSLPSVKKFSVIEGGKGTGL
jgi:hypothetical protein